MDNFSDIYIGQYVFIVAALLISLLLSFWLRYRFGTGKHQEGSFRDNPAQFHNSYVACYGKIERIFKDSFSYRLKRNLKNVVCEILRLSTTRGRYEHQRFIITSPQFRSHETILITHNVKFGKVSLHTGDWVKLCGQYIHRQGYRKGFWGVGRTFYGLIHGTHEPFGFLRVLDQEPVLSEVGEVQVVKNPKPFIEKGSEDLKSN